MRPEGISPKSDAVSRKQKEIEGVMRHQAHGRLQLCSCMPIHHAGNLEAYGNFNFGVRSSPAKTSDLMGTLDMWSGELFSKM